MEDKCTKGCQELRHSSEKATEVAKVSHEEESGSHLLVTAVWLLSVHPQEAQSTACATGFHTFRCYSISTRFSRILIAGSECASARTTGKYLPRKMVGTKTVRTWKDPLLIKKKPVQNHHVLALRYIPRHSLLVCMKAFAVELPSYTIRKSTAKVFNIRTNSETIWQGFFSLYWFNKPFWSFQIKRRIFVSRLIIISFWGKYM